MTERIESNLLEESICYFCGKIIYNYKSFTLYDARHVNSCFECHDSVKAGRETYYRRMREDIA